LVGTWLSVERNSLAFSTRVIGSADSCLLVHGVLDHDVDLLSTRNAKIVGESWVGKMKLATLAEETTKRLASSALHGRPLRFLVTWRAGVRAESTLGAAVAARAGASGGSLNVCEAGSELGARVLNTSPAAETDPVDFDGAIS